MKCSAAYSYFRLLRVVALRSFLRCFPVFLVCDCIDTGDSYRYYYIWRYFRFIVCVGGWLYIETYF